MDGERSKKVQRGQGHAMSQTQAATLPKFDLAVSFSTASHPFGYLKTTKDRPTQKSQIITLAHSLIRSAYLSPLSFHSAHSYSASPIFKSRCASTTSSSSSPGTVALAFPTNKNPTPFQIFHLRPDEVLTPRAIKSRYYELCLLHHPDTTGTAKGKGKASSTAQSDSDEKFRQIVAAYDILRNPIRRATYLRTGYAGSNSANSGYTARNAGYDFSRGRPMRQGGGASRGTYPSAAWDWADSHNPHFRPPGQGSSASEFTSNTSGSGWNTQGVMTSNGTIFLVLLSLTVIITPISVFSLVPAESIIPNNTTFGQGSSVAFLGGRDSRHESAAKALQDARREAKKGGMVKREAIRYVLKPFNKTPLRREGEKFLSLLISFLVCSAIYWLSSNVRRKRVREIEYEKATERALELLLIESAEMGTGHPNLDSVTLPPRAYDDVSLLALLSD